MVNNVLLDGGSKGECYNRWIKVKISVTTTLANSNNRFLCSFGCKISFNLVTYYGMFIHLMYTRVLWTTLRVYFIDFIQSILNIYLTILWAYWIEFF